MAAEKTAGRKEKLAEALRQNLRRRKSGAAARDGETVQSQIRQDMPEHPKSAPKRN